MSIFEGLIFRTGDLANLIWFPDVLACWELLAASTAVDGPLWLPDLDTACADTAWADAAWAL